MSCSSLRIDAVEGDGADLVVADGEPGPAAAYQVAIDAGRMDERNNGGVFDDAEFAALQVIDLEAQQFGKVEDWSAIENCLSP